MKLKDDVESMLRRFRERMKLREDKEEKEAKEKAERLRQHYLQRTGRKEMKP